MERKEVLKVNHPHYQNMWETRLLKTFPTTGPSMRRMAITTMATSTRINAYSTNPWPSSRGKNNTGAYLLSIEFLNSRLRSMQNFCVRPHPLLKSGFGDDIFSIFGRRRIKQSLSYNCSLLEKKQKI